MADRPRKHGWIKAATANAHGQFRAKAEHDGKTTREFAGEHDGDGGKLGKEARLAETLMSTHKPGERREDRAGRRYGR